ncbi:efflux RND transporter periplasmic adaptor subunit [Gammaproteobacteria bacterium]|nr:efflux RND transporter periplasmic adaptor subunit [bacterium]MDB2374947.1 efflux RND transporter periplasmic adaptor subunit [Gammaproteobacteria bacterium]MDB9950009.1 efflux RND transporter periplasmic adaptor subunit [Gammaproteobacteria bacterium]
MKKQQLVAIVIFIAVVAWMLIPREGISPAGEAKPDVVVTAAPEGSNAGEGLETPLVRTLAVSEEDYTQQIRIRGRTQAFRHVMVRAEEPGKLVSEPVARGARVSQGDVLCELAIDARDANLSESLSRLEQTQFEYRASLDLQKRGLQSEVIVAQQKAAVSAAEAAVSRAELALARTKILAPFDGVVETRSVELGDLLNVGAVCASVLDDSPMLLVGLVPEQNITALEVGSLVEAELGTGMRISGHVTYLARAADTSSRSYRIEVEVDNSNTSIREGITAELLVDAQDLRAHQIPSSALTLDDNGEIGVKILDRNNVVQFQRVNIIGDSSNRLNPGVWVTGLSGSTTLVTIGQEIVFPGQRVDSTTTF